jgi:hypothetical protein
LSVGLRIGSVIPMSPSNLNGPLWDKARASLMSTFVKGQIIEICPFRQNGDPDYAAYDGQKGEVLSLHGFGSGLKVKVRFVGGLRTGERAFKAGMLKPMKVD